MNKFFWGFIFIFSSLSGYAFASTGGNMNLLDSILAFLLPLIESAAGTHGVVVQLVAIVGVLRLVFKPVMSLVQTIISLTPSVQDDALLTKILNHWAYKGFAYILDWTASIKLPKIEVKK
jgi:hypothetical protein